MTTTTITTTYTVSYTEPHNNVTATTTTTTTTATTTYTTTKTTTITTPTTTTNTTSYSTKYTASPKTTKTIYTKPSYHTSDYTTTTHSSTPYTTPTGKVPIDILTILIGGCDHKISVTEINSYHPNDIKIALPPSPLRTCGRPAGVFYNYHIVVCGGGYEGEGTPCYKTDMKTAEWTPFAPLIEHRERFTMDVVGNKLVVVGGFKAGCDVEVFNGETWEEGPSLKLMHGVVHHCSVSYQENKVMVIGGLVDGNTTDLVQTVDISTGEVAYVASLNSHRYSHECAKVEWHMEKYIFVAGGFEDYRITNTVEYMKEDGGQKWISISSMHIRRFNFGLSMYGSTLAAFGGEPTVNSEQIEYYDFETNEWRLTGKQLVRPDRHHFCTVEIPVADIPLISLITPRQTMPTEANPYAVEH